MRRYVFLAWLSLALSVAPAAWAGPEDEIRALFERFVAAQNAHDLSAVRDLLWDSARFLWVTRPIRMPSIGRVGQCGVRGRASSEAENR